MQRYMNHPKHGRMPVYSDAEIAYAETHGWVLESTTVAAVVEPVTTEQDVQPAVVDLAERYRAKFGKPPHHRMRPDTILAALSK